MHDLFWTPFYQNFYPCRAGIFAQANENLLTALSNKPRGASAVGARGVFLRSGTERNSERYENALLAGC